MAKQASTSTGCGCSSSRSSKQKKKDAKRSASGGDESTEESLDSLYGDIGADKVREYREAFSMLDENCDGLISASEIKSMFARIGQPVTDDEVTAMLREIDLDGNQFIDFDEFMQMMLKYESRITPEQYELSLRRVFEIFDLDKNSFITQTELKQVMSKLGEELSDEEVADMIRVADEDGDGRINFKEFRTIMEFVKTGKMGQLGSSSASSSGKSSKDSSSGKPSKKK